SAGGLTMEKLKRIAGTKVLIVFFFFSSRRRHTRFDCDWSSDVCSSDLGHRSEPAFGRSPGQAVAGSPRRAWRVCRTAAGARRALERHVGDRVSPRAFLLRRPSLTCGGNQEAYDVSVCQPCRKESSVGIVPVEQKSYEMPPRDGFTVALFLTVTDIDRMVRFYETVFGGRVLSRGDSKGAPGYVQIANMWLIVNVGGGPTPDKPS